MSDTARRRLVAGCAAALGVTLTVCLGGMVLAVAWLRSPALYGSADFIYTCAGVDLNGRFLIGIGWNYNLAGLTPVYAALPHIVCGYLPRPPFWPPYGQWLYHP